jgi:hypothetical protein
MDESVSEDEKYGYVMGTITVNYEDVKGNSYQEVIEISTKISPPQNEKIDKGEISSQWLISIITGLITIQVIIFIIQHYLKKRNI